MNGKRSPSSRARRRLMEVLEVNDFDLLFTTERPEVDDREPEMLDALKRKKAPQMQKRRHRRSFPAGAARISGGPAG